MTIILLGAFLLLACFVLATLGHAFDVHRAERNELKNKKLQEERSANKLKEFTEAEEEFMKVHARSRTWEEVQLPPKS